MNSTQMFCFWCGHGNINHWPNGNNAKMIPGRFSLFNLISGRDNTHFLMPHLKLSQNMHCLSLAVIYDKIMMTAALHPFMQASTDTYMHTHTCTHAHSVICNGCLKKRGNMCWPWWLQTEGQKSSLCRKGSIIIDALMSYPSTPILILSVRQR